MDRIQELKDLVDKYRENAGLSEYETGLVIQRTAKLLEYSEQHEPIFEALMHLPPEIGMKGFYSHFSSLDKNGQDHLIQEFFRIGKKYRSIHNRYLLRLLALCGMMISEGHHYTEHVYLTIKEIRHFAVENIKRGISIPNSRFMQRFVQKEIIARIGDQLYRIPLSSPFLEVNDLSFITNLFLFSAFMSFEKLTVLPEKQYTVLKWASEALPQMALQDKLKNLIAKGYDRWPDYLKKQFQTEPFWDLYQTQLELEKPPENFATVQIPTLNPLLPTRLTVKKPRETITPSPSIPSYLTEIGKKWDLANRTMEEAHKLYILQIEEIMKQNTTLSETIKSYAAEINGLRNEICLLKEKMATQPKSGPKKTK